MAHKHNKLILFLMIKNESKIIERCLSSLLNVVDALTILDTGSTDNTVELCNNFLSKCGKPYKVSVEPFKNFGYNRTLSFRNARQLCEELKWDLDTTYGLTIDADMVLMFSDAFRDFKMTKSGYMLIQENGSLKYDNTRLMKLKEDWNCIGSTHEYWGGSGEKERIDENLMYIIDKNDGGCKSDKFERDIRLLTEDLETNPRNERTHFYLARSYHCLGQDEKAIEMYKKRIELGGFDEEVWYSYYMIARCYEGLKDIENMECWAIKAYKYRPHRAEPLYYLTKYFRIHSEQFKAYHYFLKGKDIRYPSNDILFIEKDVYGDFFDYENTILSYYVVKDKIEGSKTLINYINNRNFNLNNVWDNLYHYTENLDNVKYGGKYKNFSFSKFEEYRPSSSCIMRYQDKLLLNVRLVNYDIRSDGSYNMNSGDDKIRTKNALIYLDKNYNPIDNYEVLTEVYKKNNDSRIQGLEDVRLFVHNDTIYCSAVSTEFTKKNRIVIGNYDIENLKIKNVKPLSPPTDTDCEKNWIYVPNKNLTEEKSKGKMNFIYEWHPLKIGSVEENDTLSIHTVYETPKFFSRFRGSSPLVEYRNKLWAVVHIVKYSTPRVYYHCLVSFDKETMKPISYSVQFCFRKLQIEYCIGLHIKDDTFCFIFSENDSNTGMITIPFDKIHFMNI